jgi:predicted DCC family thiol-disulfide oxidoreductase YuxK
MEQYPVLLFDGVCNLCNQTVQFIIEHDKKMIFRFASLQSEYGENMLKKYQLLDNQLNSVVLIYKNKIYTHAAAPLEVLRLLGGFWQLGYVFKLVPPFLSNAVYRWVAKNRYKWFGKKESCWLPTAELKSRFLG